MKAFLTALEEGRLIELPEADKESALTLLASLIEAVPSVKTNANIVEGILTRETQSVTYIGYGWACPHTRTRDEGELLCAVGWHPSGIYYGNTDGQPVRIILLYYIPEAQKDSYLKELSAIARHINATQELHDMSHFGDLNAVRLRLLDIVTESSGKPESEARAKMIRLETRISEVPSPAAAGAFDPSLAVPAWIVRDATWRIIVLSKDQGIVSDLEALPGLAMRLEKEPVISINGYFIHVRQTSTYAQNRSLFDCIVVKPPKKS